MKAIKFRPHLAEKILQGEKTSTWRLFDDKNIRAGDVVELQNWATGDIFAKAEITRVYEKPLGETGEDDYSGHETFANAEEMLATYRTYYGDKVTLETPVKIISFKLL